MPANMMIIAGHTKIKINYDPVLAGPLAAVGLADDQVVGALAKRVTASLERGTRTEVARD